MADENESGSGAGGAPEGGGAAPAAAVPAAAPAAAVPAAAAPAAAPAKPPKGARGPVTIEIPSDQLGKRIEREARSLLRRKVGSDDIEEIAALVERGRKAGAAPAAAPGGAAPAVDPEAERLRTANKLLETQLEEEKARRRRVKLRARATEVELRLRHSALSAGVREDDVDYALDRYKKAIGEAPEGKAPLPGAYWAELRKAQPFIFGGAAPAPVPISPTTAPPEGAAAGAAPAPAPAASPRPSVEVEKLDQKDFEDRTAGRYGYRPPRVA